MQIICQMTNLSKETPHTPASIKLATENGAVVFRGIEAWERIIVLKR